MIFTLPLGLNEYNLFSKVNKFTHLPHQKTVTVYYQATGILQTYSWLIYYHWYALLRIGLSTHLSSQASPMMRYCSDKFVLTKQINDSIYLQYPTDLIYQSKLLVYFLLKMNHLFTFSTDECYQVFSKHQKSKQKSSFCVP